jgi:hypothetical protein
MPTPGSLVRLIDGRVAVVSKITPKGDDDRVWTGLGEEPSNARAIAEVIFDADDCLARPEHERG